MDKRQGKQNRQNITSSGCVTNVEIRSPNGTVTYQSKGQRK